MQMHQLGTRGGGGLAIEKVQLVTVALVWNMCQFEGQGVPVEGGGRRNATMAAKGLKNMHQFYKITFCCNLFWATP
jgi:hypothetical protein